MPASASRILLLACASRAAVLASMLLFSGLFSDLDSSARLQQRPCATEEPAKQDQGDAKSHLPLAVWDTVYFVRVARCGYETDKLNAFFPLLPAAMRGTSWVTGLAHLLPAEAAFTLAGVAVNLLAFCAAAYCIHRLTLRIQTSHKKAEGRNSSRSSGAITDDRSGSRGASGAAAEGTADLALLIFCFNPASVFFSAAYSESLFTAATWLGLLLLPSHHWAGVAALMVAAAARSNGILGIWFPLHKLLRSCRRHGRLPRREALRAAVSCAAIWTPYVVMQVQAYAGHCAAVPLEDRPTWCSARLPSLYGYIQREYWDVGLLRFYRELSRLPMVLMSLPVAWLSVGGCWAYFAADWHHALTLGLYSRRNRLPRWLAVAEGGLQHCLDLCRRRRGRDAGKQQAHGGKQPKQPREQLQVEQQAERQLGGCCSLPQNGEAAALVYHWALMTAVALLAMHVNVATRFLAACPPLYWHAALWAQQGGLRARLLWLWCFSYAALGCLLFPNFYPWC